MDNLEMIKAFAELEGIEVELVILDDDFCYVHKLDDAYDPITDLALTMKAVIDYDVQIRKSLVTECTRISIRGGVSLGVFDKELITEQIIRCILKSKGLYK